MKPKLLSIAIPTYNRKNDILKTVKSLIKQIDKKHENEVEICISDNASTDGTKEALLDLEKKHPNILRYTRNSKNIGGGPNIKAASDKSKGNYIWWCSDDDHIEKGIIDKLIPILKLNKYDNININYKAPEGISLEIKEDIITGNINDYFKIVSIANGFLPSVVIKKNVIEKASFQSLIWYHYDILLNIKESAKSYIIAKPYISLYRPEKNTWVNSKNLLEYTIEICESIMKSSLEDNTKKHLLDVYKKDLCRMIKNTKKKNKKLKINYKNLSNRLSNAKKYYNYNWDYEQKMLNSRLQWRLMYKIKKLAYKIVQK